MTTVRLELNKIQIHRPKERWKVYFVVATDHPNEPDQVMVSVVPGTPILVVPEQNNVVHFEPKGAGSEGLLLLTRKMPKSREINVHFHVMHSRRANREIGTVLKKIEGGVQGKVLGATSELLGTSAPWLTIARSGLPLIGQVLASLPDRPLGFVSMFERFGPEFEREAEIDRESRGGHITVVYSWSVV
ncbi:MAG: hypothetical protein JNK10_05200 [Cyclobacteriaceae bacterium]|nr:hypothetical protein [Cyclobacteriaceae bacterium]